MRKILLTLLILAQLTVMAETKKGNAPVSQPKSAAAAQTAKTEIIGKDGVKRFSTLKEAAEDYAKALQEISNYGSREMLKTINPDIDKYVNDKKDGNLKKRWEETNTLLIEQFEVLVYKINETGNDGEVIFLIKGYDETAMNKYLNNNYQKYAKIDKVRAQVDINIEEYIKMQHDYLSKTKKINLATSKVNFVKDSEGWRVVEEKK
jgi:hypothetical protein